MQHFDLCLLHERGCIAACRRIAAEVYPCDKKAAVLNLIATSDATGGATFSNSTVTLFST